MIKRFRWFLFCRISIAVFMMFSIFTIPCFAFPGITGEKNVPEDRAPDFALKDLNGKKFKLSDQRGKRPVLLLFTTTWCPWCEEKIPWLKSTYATYSKKGLVMVNIDIQESKRKVSRFAAKHKLPYQVLLDERAEVAGKYGVQGVPTMVLIDRKGMIVCRQCSYVEPLLNKMLNNK